MNDLHKLIIGYRQLLSDRQAYLPHPIYMSALCQIAWMNDGAIHYRELESFDNYPRYFKKLLVRHHRAISTTSDEFWTAVERAGEKYQQRNGLQPPERAFNIDETGFELTSSDNQLIELWDIMTDAAASDDLRSENLIRADINRIKESSIQLRKAINQFHKNFTGEASCYFDDYYKIWPSEPEHQELEPSLTQLPSQLIIIEDILQNATLPIRAREKPKRHKIFANQISDWFRETEGQRHPRKKISQDAAAVILRDEDPSIEILDDCF